MKGNEGITVPEKLFRLRERGTNVKTELLAGLTTFATMAYILAVNPDILAAAGMEFNRVFCRHRHYLCRKLYYYGAAGQPSLLPVGGYGPERFFHLCHLSGNGIFLAVGLNRGFCIGRHIRSAHSF